MVETWLFWKTQPTAPKYNYALASFFLHFLYTYLVYLHTKKEVELSTSFRWSLGGIREKKVSPCEQWINFVFLSLYVELVRTTVWKKNKYMAFYLDLPW